ncbi:MAG: HlyD family secretion protein [Aureliella sp.]
MISRRHTFMTATSCAWALMCLGCSQPKGDGEASGVSPPDNKIVYAQGEILPRDGFIQLLAQPGDTVISVAPEAVVFGEPIEAGMELVQLSSAVGLQSQIDALAKELEATRAKEAQELSQARGKLELVRQKLKSLESRKDRLPAKRELLALAKSQVDGAKGVLQKLEQIARSPMTTEFVGDLEIDRQRIAVDEAQLKYNQQKDALEQGELDLADQITATELELKLAVEAVATAEGIVESGANVASVLESKMDALRAQKQAAEIRVPKRATLVSMNVTEGGSVLPQLPVVELADLSRIVCQVEINERDADRVSPGNKVTIRSRAFEGEITGYVDTVHGMVGRPKLRSLDPLARTDYRSVTAIVAICDPAKAQNWLQLHVEVEIDTESEFDCDEASSSDSVTPEESDRLAE